jgi:hypothetical protein
MERCRKMSGLYENKKWRLSEMKMWKKGAILGGIWGLISIPLMLKFAPAFAQPFKLKEILFLPASLSARTILGPAVGLIIIWPIISILIGLLIGAILGYLYSLFRGRREK